jgi:hypothetical protein
MLVILRGKFDDSVLSTPTEKMSYNVSAHYAAEINAQKLPQSASQANSWH